MLLPEDLSSSLLEGGYEWVVRSKIETHPNSKIQRRRRLLHIRESLLSKSIRLSVEVVQSRQERPSRNRNQSLRAVVVKIGTPEKRKNIDGKINQILQACRRTCP